MTIVAAGGQQADFYDGIFRFGQGEGAKPLTTLTLVEALSCPKAGKAVVAARRRSGGCGVTETASSEPRASTVRRLMVGTRWLVEDRCTSTTTRVVKGVVSVRDFAKRKTVRVKAGKKYVGQS